MRKPRPYRSPDDLDWRDPNMPAYVNTKSQGIVLWDPERVRRAKEFLVECSEAPHYTEDPTYNLSRKERSK